MFGCERYGYLPDMITSAKGLTSGYSPLGAVIAREFLVKPFLEGKASFTHGITFAGHPVSCAVALANLDVFEREDLCGNVLRNEDGLRTRLESLLELPIVGDVRGAGYFWALELVPRREPAIGSRPTRSSRCSVASSRRGCSSSALICRTDDRGDPVVQFAPTLVAGPEQLDEIVEITRTVLTEAWKRFTG